MGNAKKELQKAFSLKEKNENLLTNLENLKKGGTLSEEQYNSIKIGYATSLTEAKTAIEQIKLAISQTIMAEEQNAQMLDMELQNISVRFKTGEMKVEESQRSQERIRKKIQQSNDKIADFKRLFNSTNSSEVGGYIDTKPGTSFQARSSSSGISLSGMSLPDTGTLISSIKGTSASDFTEIRTDISEITGSRDELIGLVGGIILFISLFLPWVSFLGLGLSIINMTSAPFPYSLYALGGLVLGLAGIGSAFLARENARGTLQFFVGLVPFLVLAYLILSSFFTPSSYSSSYLSSYSNSYSGMSVFQFLGIGFYLFFIGAVMLIIAGMMELKK